jgi:hypothetical protein
MRPVLIRFTVALAISGPLAVAPAPATAADCELAIRHATYVAAQGERAIRSKNYIEAGNAVSSARIPSIDAWEQAKACGCVEAVPPLEDATLIAGRADRAFDLANAQSYGARIKKDADAALEALRRCAAR